MEFDELIDEIDTAISALAKRIAEATGSVSAAVTHHHSAAARELAEARAWLVSPDQPHGGNSSVDVSGK